MVTSEDMLNDMKENNCQVKADNDSKISELGFKVRITKEVKHRDGSYTYHFDLDENGVSLTEAVYKSGMQKVIDFIEKRKPTRPDKNSCTQYSYYAIDEHEVEAFKKENL